MTHVNSGKPECFRHPRCCKPIIRLCIRTTYFSWTCLKVHLHRRQKQWVNCFLYLLKLADYRFCPTFNITIVVGKCFATYGWIVSQVLNTSYVINIFLWHRRVISLANSDDLQVWGFAYYLLINVHLTAFFSLHAAFWVFF